MTSPQEVITLNVGGVLYTTTRSTLTKFGESMLSAMFSGRHQVTSLDRDGNPFIDRDGPMFRHVLNFLRTGRLSLPGDFCDYDMLEDEADFYQIEALAQAMRDARRNVDESVKANPSVSQSYSMFEMYEIIETNTRLRVDDLERRQVFLGGVVMVSGRRRVLLSLPLDKESIRNIESNNFSYMGI